MCQPKPFPRCSAHARTRKAKAKERVLALVQKKKELISSDASSAKIHKIEEVTVKALKSYMIASEEYDETPAGLRELEDREQKLRSTGKESQALEVKERLVAAKERRAKKVALSARAMTSGARESENAQAAVRDAEAIHEEQRRKHRDLVDAGADEETVHESAQKLLKTLGAIVKARHKWEETSQGLQSLRDREEEALANNDPYAALAIRKIRHAAEDRIKAKSAEGMLARRALAYEMVLDRRAKYDQAGARHEEQRRRHRDLVNSGADEETVHESAQELLKTLDARAEARHKWEETSQGLQSLRDREDAALADRDPHVALAISRSRYAAEARARRG